MTVAVRVKRKALVDDRDKVQILADLAGYNAYEALGRLVHLWDKCISTKSDVLNDVQVDAFLGRGNAAALISSGLAQRVPTGVRVCGALEEIEARSRLTEQRRSAGFASVVARTIDQRTADESLTDRQRTANEPFTGKSLSDLLPDSGSLFSEASSSSETPEDLKQQGSGRRKKAAHAMPVGFGPDDADREYAGKNRIDVEDEFARFRDHNAAKGNWYADWRAAFRNWLRNTMRYRAERTAQAGHSHGVDRKKALT